MHNADRKELDGLCRGERSFLLYLQKDFVFLKASITIQNERKGRRGNSKDLVENESWRSLYNGCAHITLSLIWSASKEHQN